MSEKQIWIINQYAMPPYLEPRLQTIKVAEYLKKNGYDVKIFASSLMHNMDLNLIEDGSVYLEKIYDNLNFIFISSINYKNSRIKRIISSFQFVNRFIKYAKNTKKPDIIIHIPGFLLGYKIAYFSKKFHIKYITQVLDLYPESLVELGIFKRNNPIIKILRYFELKMYKMADEHIFSMEGGKDYIIDQKWNKQNGGPIDLKTIHYINNGVDLNDFEFNKVNYIVEDADLTNNNIKKVMYIGSIRLANNVMQLVKAAEVLKGRNDIKFFIYGNGEERPIIETYIKEHDLSNILLKDKWIEPKYVPYIISQADVNVLNYMPGGFGHYGGSQSKMFQYMASGKPICCNLKMSYCPINKYNIGVAKEFKSAEEYASSIVNLISLPTEEYNNMCLRAKDAAKNYNYEFLTTKIIKLL